MLPLYIPLVLCGILKMKVLYEKDDNVEQSAVRAISENVIKKYNTMLSDKSIEIVLEDVMSYKTYSQKSVFDELSGLAGTGDITGRLYALRYTGSNVIMLISSLEEIQDSIFHMVDECNAYYVANTFVTPQDSMADICARAIHNWLEELFGVEIPNLSTSDEELIQKGRSIVLDERFEQCGENPASRNRKGSLRRKADKGHKANPRHNNKEYEFISEKIEPVPYRVRHLEENDRREYPKR